MDKYEYRVRANEIEELIKQGEYAEAAEIADTIDWRRVKSVMMLCKISDLYKINRRYEDARDMLLLAYERRPGGRTICYSLCELSIKMEEYVQAIEYYKEYVQAATSPMDTGRYILQYKLYEAQDVSLEERIAVLEKLKQCDYLPKWGYELAYLYHRVGLASRCVEECDEFIAWFGDGKYVIKAMELKMLHQPLSPEQQKKYNHRFDDLNVEQEFTAQENSEEVYAEGTADVQNADVYQTAEEWQAGTDTRIYDAVPGELESSGEVPQNPDGMQVYADGAEQAVPSEQDDEMDIHVKTMDVGQYNTINLQAELAQGLREVMAEERFGAHIENPITQSIIAPMLDSNTEALDYPDADEADGEALQPVAEEIESSEVFFGETGEISSFQETLVPDTTAEIVMAQLRQENAVNEGAAQAVEAVNEAHVQPIAAADEAVGSAATTEEGLIQSAAAAEETAVRSAVATEDVSVRSTEKKNGRVVYPQTTEVMHAEPPKSLANVLSQESDGQLSLVMPEKESIEKQITGQISLEDILAEWERIKKENQEKREAEVRQHVLQQTGTMFTEFEASVRDGLLEQLERGRNIEGTGQSAEEKKAAVEEDTAAEEAQFAEEEAAAEEELFVEENITTEEIQFAEEEPVTEEVLFTEEDTATDEALTAEEEALGEEQFQEEIMEEVPAEEYVVEEEQPNMEREQDDSGDTDEVEELEEIQEETEEETGKEPEQEDNLEQRKPPVVERDKEKVRSLTREEKEIFAPFIQSKASREQLVKAIDNISLAAFTGNVIITGEEGMDTLSLAKNMIREVQATDSNFSGKVAKISGKALNKKDVAATLGQLKNGALIIAKASEMNDETAKGLYRALQQESMGIIVVLEDSRKAIDRFLNNHEELRGSFTARMDVEALSNDMLVAFGRQYARGLEYSIDNLGILALHTRIEDMQTIDHAVTVVEVKEIVDEAIRHANRKTLGHFFDILFAKRYDEEDMIILSEKDFV